jgi:hypothetical protein
VELLRKVRADARYASAILCAGQQDHDAARDQRAPTVRRDYREFANPRLYRTA